MTGEEKRRRGSLDNWTPLGIRGDMRIMVINEVQWRVFEYLSPYDRREEPSLIFATEELFRRLRSFPENWRTLDDAALFRLANPPDPAVSGGGSSGVS